MLEIDKTPMPLPTPHQATEFVRVKMLRTVDGSLDGQTLKTFHEGEEYELPNDHHHKSDLGRVFLSEGWAVKVETKVPAEETELLKPDTKPDPDDTELPVAETPKVEVQPQEKREYRVGRKR